MKQETVPNKITGTNAGGRRQLPVRTRWAARVAQFGRYAAFANNEEGSKRCFHPYIQNIIRM
jgi:hypothetical protein